MRPLLIAFLLIQPTFPVRPPQPPPVKVLNSAAYP
jgi:hypothetical protein